MVIVPMFLRLVSSTHINHYITSFQDCVISASEKIYLRWKIRLNEYVTEGELVCHMPFVQIKYLHVEETGLYFFYKC